MSRLLSFIFLFSLSLSLSGCIPMLDFRGKGSRMGCLYLDVASMTIFYKCGNDGLESLSVWCHKSKVDSAYDRIFSTQFDEPVKEYRLPFHKDSIMQRDLEIKIHLPGDHWRMVRHISIQPNDLKMRKKILAFFTSH